MATMTIEERVTYGSTNIVKANTLTGGLVTQLIDESVADSSTDYEITLTLDVSAVKAFFLNSDQAVTFETNDGTTPANTISLAADIPYVWYTGKYDSFLLTTDVTSIFITNASGSAATVNLWALIDATP